MAPSPASDSFDRLFGHTASATAQAPGRVNLIGEHTDYSGGFVLPMALQTRTVLAAGPSAVPRVSLHSAEFDATVDLDLRSVLVPRSRHWSNYAAGVIAGFQTRGVTVPGLDVVIESDVPVGAGLSSSAALETPSVDSRSAAHRFMIPPVGTPPRLRLLRTGLVLRFGTVSQMASSDPRPANPRSAGHNLRSRRAQLPPR